MYKSIHKDNLHPGQVLLIKLPVIKCITRRELVTVLSIGKYTVTVSMLYPGVGTDRVLLVDDALPDACDYRELLVEWEDDAIAKLTVARDEFQARIDNILKTKVAL